jgi:hypothetical protein
MVRPTSASFAIKTVVPSPSFSTNLFMSGEDDAKAAADGDELPNNVPKEPVKCPKCDRCDGSGRILGGLGVIAPWWPIKAYRPCPNFIEAGGNYERAGQGLDEIAFGRDKSYNSDEY